MIQSRLNIDLCDFRRTGLEEEDLFTVTFKGLDSQNTWQKLTPRTGTSTHLDQICLESRQTMSANRYHGTLKTPIRILVNHQAWTPQILLKITFTKSVEKDRVRLKSQFKFLLTQCRTHCPWTAQRVVGMDRFLTWKPPQDDTDTSTVTPIQCFTEIRHRLAWTSPQQWPDKEIFHWRDRLK